MDLPHSLVALPPGLQHFGQCVELGKEVDHVPIDTLDKASDDAAQMIKLPCGFEESFAQDDLMHQGNGVAVVMGIPFTRSVQIGREKLDTLEFLQLSARFDSRASQQVMKHTPRISPSLGLLQEESIAAAHKPQCNWHVGTFVGDAAPFGYQLIDDPIAVQEDPSL